MVATARMSATSRVGLTIAGLVVGLGLADLLVRVLDVPPRPVAPLNLRGYVYSPDPVLGYGYRPGYNQSWGGEACGTYECPINQDGFRDAQRVKPKPAGVRRVVVLGDSTTSGNGVEDLASVYPAVLESRLRLLPEHSRDEVLNLGVGGYHTMQEARLLEVAGLGYEPDVVVLTICLNDFAIEADAGAYTTLAGLAAVDNSVSTGILRSVLAHSRLAFAVYARWHPTSQTMAWYTENVLHHKTAVRAGLELVSALQQQHGFALRVVILPDFTQPFSDYRSLPLHRQILEEAAGLPGVEVIDLLPGFEAVTDDAPSLSGDGNHLNVRGHLVMADLLLPLLVQSLDQPE